MNHPKRPVNVDPRSRGQPDDWRARLDAFLAEQEPAGYKILPEHLPPLLEWIPKLERYYRRQRAARVGETAANEAEDSGTTIIFDLPPDWPTPQELAAARARAEVERQKRHALYEERIRQMLAARESRIAGQANSRDANQPFVITVVPDVSGPDTPLGPQAVLINGVEVAGAGPEVSASYKAKVQQALNYLDPKVANWWKANSVRGQIRSRDAAFGQFSYYSKRGPNDQPFIYVDHDFTAGQTAQAIIREASNGWLADSIGAYYKKFRFSQTGDYEEFLAWQRGAARDAARQASVLAELYVSGIASLAPGGDLIVTIGDVADNGPRWDQLLSVLPLVGFLPVGAVVVNIGKRSIKIPKPLARKLEALGSKRRKALLAHAAAAKSDDEAAAIIRQGVAGRGGPKPGAKSPKRPGKRPKPHLPQEHHPISRVVHRALEKHPNLRGKYRYRDSRFRANAIDYNAHHGWEDWHRKLDAETAEWITRNDKATEEMFEAWLRKRYSEPDLKRRFPDGI